MQTTNTQSVQKTVSFSSSLYGFAVQQAKASGKTFQQYLRELVQREKAEQEEELYMVDEETEKAIGQALDDYKQGRYVTLNSREEVTKHLKKLNARAGHV